MKFECPNIPYIYRFFNVYIKAAEFYDIDNITSMEIDFREYSSSIKYNMFPVWNIEKKVFVADMKPKPSEDMKQFLHIINSKRLKMDSSYLVAEASGEIFDVYYKNDLYIATSISEKKRWMLYEFTSKIDEEFEYRLFSNRIDLHTSGHAYVETIAKLINTVKPQKVIPMHTEFSKGFQEKKEFEDCTAEVILLNDMESYVVE